MEPFEKDRLTDAELDGILPQWKAPDVPARLRSAVFPQRAAWWRRIWSTSIQVPVPVACALLVVMAIGAARLSRPAAVPGVVVKTERVEVPVIQERVVTRTVYRDRLVATAAAWQPVSELRPRIIRRGERQ